MRKRDSKKLWARAGGRCSICRTPHSDDIGLEEAHIIAREPDGPRGDPQLSRDLLDSYENRILVCPNCHGMIDGKVDEWPVERLSRAKALHEEYIRELGSEAIAELGGTVIVEAEKADDVAGARIGEPTRIKAGAAISVKASNSRRVTGVEIGGQNERG